MRAMAAQIIDGNLLAAKVREQVKARVEALRQHGRSVNLTALLIGGTPAAEMYAKRQGEACAAVGIQYELRMLAADTTEDQAVAAVDKLNHDLAVTGIMLHLPVPDHLSARALQLRINPVKDVEGVNPANLGYLVAGSPINIPCTAAAALQCVASTGVAVRGSDAVVVGASEIVGKPAALLLSDQRATVTIARSATSNLAEVCRRAKILIVAVGKPQLIGGDHVGEGAVVVDVGINRITLPDGTKKTVGDVDFDAAKQKASFITPVPGGVGPLTVAMLLQNTVKSAEALAG